MLGISQHILPFAGSLYHVELNYIREDSKCDITYGGIKQVKKIMLGVGRGEKFKTYLFHVTFIYRFASF